MHLFPISTVDLVTLLVTLSLDMKDVKQEQKIQTGILRCLENGSESNKTEEDSAMIPDLPLSDINQMYELEAQLKTSSALRKKMVIALEFMQCITDDTLIDFFSQRDEYKMSGGVNEIALINELMNKTFKIAVKQNYTMKKVSKNKETGKPKELFINTQIYRILSSKLNTLF